jgi:hypothetical protein
MAVIAALVALEKLLPWERVAKGGTAFLLIVLALCVALAPERLPGLTVPGRSEMPSMEGAGRPSMDN